jgi:selenide,water dikinase
VRRNADVKAGDAIILTKPLGVGIYSAAIKKDKLPDGGYADMIATTTLLNKAGAELAQDPSVHAITDVTGFGLLGHALEMARGSKLTLALSADDLPLLPAAASLSQQGCVTGASHRNWSSYQHEVVLPQDFPDWRRHLLTDPQTSGGLLVACAKDEASAIVTRIKAAGFPAAGIIGHAESGPAQVIIS